MPEQGSHTQPFKGYTLTLTLTHTPTCTLMHFGGIPLPAHLKFPVFRARWCWEHSIYLETTQTASHSLITYGGAVMKCLPKQRKKKLESDTERCHLH